MHEIAQCALDIQNIAVRVYRLREREILRKAIAVAIVSVAAEVVVFSLGQQGLQCIELSDRQLLIANLHNLLNNPDDTARYLLSLF